MSLTQATKPALQFPFNGSNVDSISGTTGPTSQVSPGLTQIQGSAALVSTAPTSNTAVYFPGSAGSYMNLGTSSPASFDLGTNNLFVEAWVYFNTPLGSVNMIAQHGTGPGQDWGFYVDSSGTLHGFIWGNSSTVNIEATLGGISSAKWYHVAFSFDSVAKSSRVYINGGTPATVTNAAVTPNYNASLPIWFGNYNNANYLNGYIQDLRIVKGVVVPTTSFTPVLPPFSSPLPYSLTGTPVYTLLGQFITYKSGKIQNQAINFPNSSSTGTTAPTTYIEYAVSLNSTPGFTISLCVNFNVGGVFAQVVLMAGTRNILFNDGSRLHYYDNTNDVYFPLPTLTVGTWYNPVIVVSGTTATLYLNGNSTVGTTNFTSETVLRVGGSGANYSAWCSVQDLRIYNTALSDIQVQALYANGGAPSVPASLTLYRAQGLSSSMTGTPLLSQLSVAPVGAFSLRAVNGLSPGGTAKAVNVRRASDNATQDFYADRLGNLLTAPVTGTDLATWLGGATGYVATWYDQSGAGKDATQTNQALRPSITQDASGRYQMDFTANGGTSYFNATTGTVPMQTAYTVICRYNTMGNTNSGICGAGQGVNSQANNFRRNGNGYQNYWWNNDINTSTGYAPGTVVTFKFTADTSPTNGITHVYTNGTEIVGGNITGNPRSGWIGVSGNEFIARTIVAGEPMNGQMYSLFLFSSALSDSDRIAVENAS